MPKNNNITPENTPFCDIDEQRENDDQEEAKNNTGLPDYPAIPLPDHNNSSIVPIVNQFGRNTQKKKSFMPTL